MLSDTVNDLTIGNALDQAYGAMIPERVLQDLLKLGFQQVKSNPDILEDLFYKLDSNTLRGIKQFFVEKDVAVRLNFPRDDIVFPIVSVVNASDTEDTSSDLLGDFLTADYDTGITQEQRAVGHAVRSDLNIYCLAGKDANVALWLYYLAKAIIVLNTKTLNSHGLHNIVLSGRDIALREDLFPEFTYGRVLTLTCLNYFSVNLSERVAKYLNINVLASLS